MFLFQCVLDLSSGGHLRSAKVSQKPYLRVVGTTSNAYHENYVNRLCFVCDVMVFKDINDYFYRYN